MRRRPCMMAGRLIDVAWLRAFPEIDDARHAKLEFGRVSCQGDGVNGADGRAHDDRKRVPAVRHDLGNGPSGRRLDRRRGRHHPVERAPS